MCLRDSVRGWWWVVCCFGLALPLTAVQARQILARFTHCYRYSSPFLKKSVEYCLDRSRPDLPEKSKESLIYFMHGAFQGASQWYNDEYADTLREFSKMKDYPPFTVVSFNTSGMSFFTDEGDVHEGNQAFETWFLKEFMGFVESQHTLCHSVECRGLLGTSMGGFGALKTVMRYPQLFRYAGVNFPAILPRNIYDWNLDEWQDYFKDKGIGPTVGRRFIVELRKLFPTRELYDAHDPVMLAEHWKENAQGSFPALYFDVGGHDEFGFFDGFHRFKSVLEGRGFSFESRFDPSGDHFKSDGSFSRPLLEWTARQVDPGSPRN